MCWSRNSILIGAFFLTVATSRADDPALKARIVRELPTAWKKLESHYTNFSGAGVYSYYTTPPQRPGGPPPPREAATSVQKINFRVRHKLMRIDRETVADKYFDAKKNEFADKDVFIKNGYREKHSLLVGATGAYELSWENKDSLPFLKSVRSAADESFLNRVEIGFGRFVTLVYGEFGTISLRPAIERGDGVVSAELVDSPSGSGPWVKLDVEFDTPPVPARFAAKIKGKSLPPKSHAWIVVAPDELWAVQQFSLTNKPKRSSADATLIYKGVKDGIPLLAVSEFKPPTAFMRQVLEIEGLDFNPPPESDFTLTAYGIPEIDRPAVAASRRPFPIAWFAVATALLGVGVLLKIMSGRLRRRPGSATATEAGGP